MSQELQDFELMQGIRNGDQQALTALYAHYGGAVYSLAYYMLQDTVVAEEITQDVFMRVWEQALKWDPERGSLGGWLMQITRFRTIDRIRHEKRFANVANTPIDEMPDVASHPSYVDLPLWADGQILRDLIKQLPQDQYQVIYLAYFNGLSHSEIVNRTGLPLGTIKSRLRLGLQKLRALWEMEAGLEIQ